MRTALQNRGIPKTANDIISRLHEISSDVDTINASVTQRYEVPRTDHTPNRAKEDVYDPMEWEPTNTRVQVGRAGNVPNQNGFKSKRPEDKPLLGKRAKWVSREEIGKRKAEGRCIRCGRDGCRVMKCPLKAAVKPRRSPSSSPPRAKTNRTAQRARVTEAALDEDRLAEVETSSEESSDNEQGKA